ncbi:MAG: GtrA family protein [Acidobacteria bacterium]|nr:GtrA family protein [Acidobacteriota bacterium]
MRCLKFYAVGALGILVHVGSLAILVRGFEMRYELATAVAVEMAVLHNFVWHRKWTWADRPVTGFIAVANRLLRFNLANGLVSVLGNLYFMHLFAGVLRLDPVISSLISIVPCGILNFVVSDRWVFVPQFRSPASVNLSSCGTRSNHVAVRALACRTTLDIPTSRQSTETARWTQSPRP